MTILQVRILSSLRNGLLRYNKMAFRAKRRVNSEEFAKKSIARRRKSARSEQVPLHFCDRLESGCVGDKRRDFPFLSYSSVCLGGNYRESRDCSAGIFSQFRNRRPP